jgi:hypothetical protein
MMKLGIQSVIINKFNAVVLLVNVFVTLLNSCYMFCCESMFTLTLINCLYTG